MDTVIFVVMKLFFGILACFMLWMSCLPCGDIDECNDSAATVSSSANHQQHEHQPEACSPFCACACCGISAFYSSLIKAQPSKLVFLSKRYPLFHVALTAYPSYSVWQPPRLS
jgi:hypothetical protein